jgi:hypothetical protein
MWFCMLSPDEKEQQRAMDALLKSKDLGKAFLRGGWKEDPKAEELGKDVGLERKGGESEELWYEQGRSAMEKVVEGLSAF